MVTLKTKGQYEELEFDNLEKAKRYFMPTDNFEEEDYIGDDYKNDKSRYIQYQDEIETSESLEELAYVLNKYTDIFGNGIQYIIKKE